MVTCDRCDATFFGGYAPDPGCVEGIDTSCPLCLLELTPAERSLSGDVEEMARATFTFETNGEIRERILRYVTGESTDDRSGAFRNHELRAVARALGVSAGVDRTNRELRAFIADRAGVDANPSSSFRTDALVEIALALFRVDDGRDTQARLPN